MCKIQPPLQAAGDENKKYVICCRVMVGTCIVFYNNKNRILVKKGF
jgi:hypothetical protein